MAGGQERELRRRIRSVEATKKITRAMELIAASQMVRAQGRIVGTRPYVEGMERVLATTASETSGAGRLVGEPEDPRTIAIVSIVADRGLCGGYNANVLRTVERAIRAGEAEGRSIRLITVGRKAIGFFRFRGRAIDLSFSQMSDRPTYADARQVAAEVVRAFLAEEVDAVELVSTRYRSAGVQVVETRRLLPLAAPELDEAEGEHAAQGYYEFEPEPEDLLELLVPQYVEAALFQALLEASASEHTARQRAMSAATENAEDMITHYRRQMNRARQDSITTEIMEIIGGAEALRASGVDTRTFEFSLSEENIA